MSSDFIRIVNPRKLRTDRLPAQRIPLGRPGDYKPNLVRRSSGELFLIAFRSESVGKGLYDEYTVSWRSNDDGATWSDCGKIEGFIGREHFLTCLKDGTLLATCHLLEQDIRNKQGYCHSYIQRSTDGGRTWENTQIGPEGFPPRATSLTTRNVIELPDGRIMFAVTAFPICGIFRFWVSRNNGVTWDSQLEPVVRDFNGEYVFSEGTLFRTESGKFLLASRIGHDNKAYSIEGEPPPPPGWDHLDRMILFYSDDGQTWSKPHRFGDYGEMYPCFTQLQDGRVLFNFTVRDLNPPLGVRAILSDDKGKTWDFESDRIVIEEKTPFEKESGGGFGNTIQLPDGGLISCYSYMGADNEFHVEVVRWRLP